MMMMMMMPQTAESLKHFERPSNLTQSKIYMRTRSASKYSNDLALCFGFPNPHSRLQLS